MPKKIKCQSCNGAGVVDVSESLSESHAILKRNGAMTAARFSQLSELELTNAHHRLTRMVRVGLVKKSEDKPAVYKAT